MLKQRPTLDITRSNNYKVRAQVDKVKFHFVQLARDDIAERYDVHCIESGIEQLEFITLVVADNKCFLPVAEHVEGGIQSPNPIQRELKAEHKLLASTILPGGSIPMVYLHHIFTWCE